MSFVPITKLFDLSTLTAKQRKALKAILKKREKQLKKAIADVESALDKLEPDVRTSEKRNVAKRRR